MVANFFKPQYLQERQCIAHTSKDRQCRARTSEGRLCLALKLLRRTSINGEKVSESRETIIRLLVCDMHRLQVDSLLDGLIKKYQPEFHGYARTHEPKETTILRQCVRNNRTNFRSKLKSAIKGEQFDCGHIHIFTWPYMPHYIKVGCTKNSPAERIKQWAKCYPDAVAAYSVWLNFPQRIEELFHLQIVDKRYDILGSSRSCKSTYHDVWFLSSIEEMRASWTITKHFLSNSGCTIQVRDSLQTIGLRFLPVFIQK